MSSHRVLTVHQPWASLLVAGVKRYETRSWATDHRGRLLIHAGTQRLAKWMVGDEPWESALIDARMTWEALPYGAIVGHATLLDCHRIPNMEDRWDLARDTRELALGDWTPGRYAWELDGPVWWDRPVPARGRQGIWHWDGEVRC